MISLTRLRAAMPLLCALALSGGAQAQQATRQPLCNAVTVVGACPTYQPNGLYRAFQATGQTTAGAGSATIVVQVSNIESPGSNDWITLGTITLTLSATPATDGFVSVGAWAYVRGNVTALTGTAAAVTLIHVGR